MTADDYERDFWGDCTNTFDEEQKHYVYALCMGLQRVRYSFDGRSRAIVDIGGGPVSMLLKTINLKGGLVVDPLRFPDWVYARYAVKGIEWIQIRGEDFSADRFDEAWIYNCLQHTDDPERIIANAKRSSRVLRLFEWIDIPAYAGHPHMLTEASLTKWIGQRGQTAQLNESGCVGRAFFGSFSLE
jgi:hypothetical protein